VFLENNHRNAMLYTDFVFDVTRSEVDLVWASLFQSAYLVSGSECRFPEQMWVRPAVAI
jgi:hypothetical protein